MKSYTRILFLFLILLLLAACSQPNDPDSGAQVDETPSYPPPTAPENSESYPAPTTYTKATPYPEPNSADKVATVGPIPTPGSTWGILTGTLLENGKPVTDYSLYLAEIITNEAGEEAIVKLNRSTSPRAFLDENGNFVFSNIKPGRYGLILDFVLNSFLLHYPGSEEQILVTIEAEDILDIGELDYDTLPRTR